MILSPIITIFIPVYNGEHYLRKTLTSIQNQTYTNFEVLLVDDSSTDNSKSILNDFANSDSRFKIFTKQNGGSAACSWNFIMPEIKGDFVFYSSQDDIFSVDLLEKMIKKQMKTNADTVVPDMEFYSENTPNNEQIIGLNGNREITLNGRQACIESIHWNIHGFTLTRTSIVKQELFPEDAFDTDEFMTRKWFLHSNKVVFSEGIFYYRQDNSNAITKNFSKKNFYTLNTLNRLYWLLKENQFPKNYIVEIQYNVLLKYIHLSAIHQFHNFNSLSDKEETRLFLIDFRKKLNYNLEHYAKLLNLKVTLLLIICRFNLLYRLTTAFYVKKLRRNI